MEVSEFDQRALEIIRENVADFIGKCAKEFDRDGYLVLDIAPQDHDGAVPHFQKSHVETLDIDPDSAATYIADLCDQKSEVPFGRFDCIICTEVLEHTLQPFHAVENIYRFLKPGGVAYITTPFNFRIHGPLPDCWRFTEHGLRALFSEFEVLNLEAVDVGGRWLMPLQYKTVVKKREQ